MSRTTELRRTALFVVMAVMAGFGLTGVASAQSLTNTGNSWGYTKPTANQNRCSETNTSNVNVSNSNNQTALSGNAYIGANDASGTFWSGWDALDPSDAQTQGMSYNSWWSGVVNWVSNHANGAGWVGGNSVPTSSSGNGWDSFDPMTWQTNGMKFGDWYSSVENYLSSNSPTWLLGWPSSDNNSGAFSATTGNATNNFNANFSINISNAANAKYGTPACGYESTTAPTAVACPCSNSVASTAHNLVKPAIQSSPSTSTRPSSSTSPPFGAPANGNYASSYGPSYTPPEHVNTAISGTPSYVVPSYQNVSAPCPPSSSSSQSAPQATPNTAYKPSVTNTSVVNISNVSSQTATTGNASTISSGMSGSGIAANGNGAGMNTDIDQ